MCFFFSLSFLSPFVLSFFLELVTQINFDVNPMWTANQPIFLQRMQRLQQCSTAPQRG